MPHGVAIVGASEKSMWFGNFRRNLTTYGYPGQLWPVNPTTESVFGVPTFASLSAIGQPIDAVAVVLGAARCPAAVAEAVELGVEDIVVVATGFAEMKTPEGIALEEQLIAACKPSTRLYGPNGVGFADFTNKLCLVGEPLTQDQSAGVVSIVSQSGALLASIMAAVVEDGGGIDWCVSLGNAAQFDLARAIDHIVSRGFSRSICVYAETLGEEPERSAAALRRAADAGITVVMLKAGRSPVANRIAYAHTASVAGDDAQTAAFLKAHGVIRVDSLEEMARVAVLAPMRRAGRGTGVAIVGSSGGQAAIAGELAHRDGLKLARLAEDTMARVRAVTGGGSSFIDNPFDLTGGSGVNADLFAAVYGDPGVGFVLSPWSITFPDHSVEQRHNQPLVRLTVKTALEQGAPTVISSLVNVPWTDWMREIRRDNPHVAIVRGIETTIRALSRLFPDDRRTPGDDPHGSDGDAVPAQADPGALVGEAEGRAMLDGLDLPLVDGASCAGVDEAVAAAQRLGFPVVVKVDVRGVAHKAKLGLVTVGCQDAADVSAAVDSAYESLDRHGIDRADVAAILVQRMVSGTEVLVGLHRSPLGEFLSVGRGGVAAGAGTVATTLMLPVPPETIRGAVAEASGRAADGAGVTQAAEGIARLAAAFTDGPLAGYATVEVNPAMVTDSACAFVDVLMVAR
jgi:acyl-CoA synthetase (NDP forming)